MDSNVGRQDKELKNILDDLNDEKAPQAFNRKYFANNDSLTPSNTPSAKNNAGFSLKSIDFDKFLDLKANEDLYEESSKQSLKYCEDVLLSKGSGEYGYNNNNNKICNSLLCMKCDLKVSMFKSRRWCDTADYLFFRNNYGDQIKLGEKLIPDNNVTCYSCQCTWLNISDNVISVDKIKNVDWTCNGHHDI